MAAIGTAGPVRTDALERSTAFWTLALNDGEGGWRPHLDFQSDLPRQPALAFRGVWSFWSAGEIADGELDPVALVIADTLMLTLMG